MAKEAYKAWLLTVGDTPRGNKQAKHWNTFATMEWRQTSIAIRHISDFWSDVFQSISQFIILSHRYDREWHLIPITGHEESDFTHINIPSLAYRNPAVRNITTAGLTVVGQLFQLNNMGNIDISRLKSFEHFEQEFDVVLPNPVRNSITGLVTRGNLHHSESCEGPLFWLSSRNEASAKESKTRMGVGRYAKKLQYILEGWSHRNNISSIFCLTVSITKHPPVPVSSMDIHPDSNSYLWTNMKEQRTARNLVSLQPISNLCSNIILRMLPVRAITMISLIPSWL